MRYQTAAIVFFVALGLAASASAQSGFKIVAHPSVSVDSMAAKPLSDIFLKKKGTWSDGSRALPVDLPLSSQVRETFSEQVHSRRAAAVDAYWQKQVFSGRSAPPVTHASDSDVLSFVKSHPGAVGYVSASASTAGVKTITLK